MKQWMRGLVPLAVVTLAATACSSGGGSSSNSSDLHGKTVNVIGTWGGDEQKAFLQMVAPWEQQTGAKVKYTGTRDINTVLTTGVASGVLPDLAGLPGPGQMAELRKLLAGAKAPLVILGGGGWSAKASADIAAFAEINSLPITNSFRCQDLMDNQHPNYAGDVGIGINPKLAERVRGADVLLVIGARLGEMTTSGYTLIDIPRPRQTLVHVHAGVEELGRVYQPALAINSGMPQFAAAARALAGIVGAPAPGHDLDLALVVLVGGFAVDAVELDVGVSRHVA